MNRFYRGSIARNSIFSVAQNIVATTCIFIAFKMVIAHAGIERFGVWSLLLAASAFGRLGDISGGGALNRFVAASGSGGHDKATVVHTVILASATINGFFALMILAVLPYLVVHLVAPAFLAEARALVPYAAASLFVGSLAIAITSGIDGTQRADQRAIVVIVGSIAFLLSCALLVPTMGVVGFGIAQVIQPLVVLILGWYVLRRHIRNLGWVPSRWSRDTFVEVTSYAIKLNFIGLMGLLFDPLAKFAFNHAGGPSLVALYDLASRLIAQVRGLVIAAAMPLVPAFAARGNASDPQFQVMLEKTTRAAAISAIGVAAVTAIAAPIVSILVLGRLSGEFASINATLTLGWALQLPCIGFYFAAQGHGILRWNILSHVIISSSVIVGALFAGHFTTSAMPVFITLGLIFGGIVAVVGNAVEFSSLPIVRRTIGIITVTSITVLLIFIVSFLFSMRWPQ